MFRSLVAACFLASFAPPAIAGTFNGVAYPVDPRETCDSLAEGRAAMQVLASNHHTTVFYLEGDQAHRFIAAINPPGSKIVLEADYVAVFQEPAFQSGYVWIANLLCGGFGTGFPMRLPDLKAALAKAQH
ncbi:hypothetical protein [Lichenifustis flavocetrariae]|uniref:Uncharacterized protein n=1 Tax=Lichenifustis flavocetrariae TaxID=2949735 RepID=A0AA42CL61_9HYPH|nr:hypothetical protein [Lichenifustis flavocetrariae]MCW6506980.1 hypothetical protein [Lichenifustis flavocetrariae]